MKKTTLFKISSLCSGIFIFIFLYSGLQKIIDFENFTSILSKSPMIPNSISKEIGYSVIMIELSIVLLFFLKKCRIAAFLLSFFLIILFEGYIILMLLYSPYLPCSCGGFIEQLSWTQHIFFNLALMALSITGFLIGNPDK
ncbi:MAG: hypothetical protein HEQ40_00695 [Lacibacter sp.]|jgi:hypothetical protein